MKNNNSQDPVKKLMDVVNSRINNTANKKESNLIITNFSLNNYLTNGNFQSSISKTSDNVSYSQFRQQVSENFNLAKTETIVNNGKAINFELSSVSDQVRLSSLASNLYIENKQEYYQALARKSATEKPFSCKRLEEEIDLKVREYKSIEQELQSVIGNITKEIPLRHLLEAQINDATKTVHQLGERYLTEIQEHRNPVTKNTCDEWKELGNQYLTSTIFDYLRIKGLLKGISPLEEEIAMKQKLEQMKIAFKQLENQLNQKDETIALKDEELHHKDDIILQQQNENHDLTDRLTVSEENNVILQNANHDLTTSLTTSEEKNVILQNKLNISEAKVVPLEKQVEELKTTNQELKTNKIELREYNKMLIDDKKIFQEEKKLFLEDKKLFLEDKKLFLEDKKTLKILQDFIVTKDFEIVELKQIHCNDPTHFEIIQQNNAQEMQMIGQFNNLE